MHTENIVYIRSRYIDIHGIGVWIYTYSVVRPRTLKSSVSVSQLVYIPLRIVNAISYVRKFAVSFYLYCYRLLTNRLLNRRVEF